MPNRYTVPPPDPEPLPERSRWQWLTMILALCASTLSTITVLLIALSAYELHPIEPAAPATRLAAIALGSALLTLALLILLAIQAIRSAAAQGSASPAAIPRKTMSVRNSQFMSGMDGPLLNPAPVAGGCTVLLIGIDAFDDLLHGHGRSTADAALEQTGRVLTNSVRTSDTVGRVGYDGFAAVLTVSNPDIALRAAQRIRNTIAQIDIAIVNGGTLSISASLGVTMCPDGHSMEAAFERAHQALTQASAKGSGSILMC